MEFACGEHYLLAPGYINTHTHVAMALLRDYGGDQPLDVWLNNYIWPAEARLSDDDVYWGSCLGMAGNDRRRRNLLHGNVRPLRRHCTGRRR